MRVLLIAAISIIATHAYSQNQDVVSAKPLYRTMPPYPAACMPSDTRQIEPQTVVVLFDVNREGETERVRIRESTDSCFETTAKAAVRAWTYEPQKANGRPVRQEDLEVTFTFVFDGETIARDFDARPIHRAPPAYPEQCFRRAEQSESVTVQFDVSVHGIPENIIVIDTTNKCFDRSAISAVKDWRYKPKLVDGVATTRLGVQTIITYELSSDASSKSNFRRTFYSKLRSIDRQLRNDKLSPAEALEELSSLEKKYGDTFTVFELSAFHRVRAIANLKRNDLAAALDDFRIAQRYVLNGDEAEALGNIIIQLETALAAQQSQNRETVQP